MGDAATRDGAFRNKEIDVAVLGPAQYTAYLADLNWQRCSRGSWYMRAPVGFNPDFKPFQDKRVRQAISYAIDASISQRLVKDKAYRAVGWLPTRSPAFDKDAKPYPYDPEKAKALLAEAGHPDGFDSNLTATQNESWGLTIVRRSCSMLAKVGIQVKAKPVEASVLADVVPAGNFRPICGRSKAVRMH